MIVGLREYGNKGQPSGVVARPGERIKLTAINQALVVPDSAEIRASREIKISFSDALNHEFIFRGEELSLSFSLSLSLHARRLFGTGWPETTERRRQCGMKRRLASQLTQHDSQSLESK